ncbi:alpha beta-hydrolase [Cylindrobasidium torrendii FP15055 ss-10]|uniref:Alpha beta-hydrolase n=1 Tax=Cylindrobasidium torrendii FP15055 ss-10 TaxID=1314674 RepID=A0A0D7BE08_9AGAR|nr:alpha beta-hydrolase [Cylindrobasidium torrendii FP15055 ss-10]
MTAKSLSWPSGFKQWHATAVVSGVALWTIYHQLQRSDLPERPRKARPGLGSLPQDVRTNIVDKLYPEDIFPGGGYADLPTGRVRYWLFGPEDGKKLVLVHGLSIPAPMWRLLAPRLAEAGYRVLVFDLYGRGYSDSPDSKFPVELYTTQLALLMQYVHWEKAYLAGVSMGSPIIAAFIDHFPHLVEEKVVLMAPAGLLDGIPRLNMLASPWFLKLLDLSVVRSYVRRSMGLTPKAAKQDKMRLDIIASMQADHLPEYVPMLLKSLRHGPPRGQHDSYKSKNFVGKNVLIIHGTADKTIPFAHAKQIQELLPEGTQSEVVYVEGGPHDLPISHADFMLSSITQFIV